MARITPSRLRISRDYEIGRIYDSVYLCRRWEGNTDSALPLETANRYDAYKDWLRTMEIQARKPRHARSRELYPARSHANI